MSQPTVFGPSAAVTMTNLALYGDSYVLTPLEFANQVNQATPNVYAFANQLAAPFVNSPMTTTAYVNIVLTNMGVNAEPLTSAVVAYMNSVGRANWGTVTLQLGQILSGLTGDATYGAAANAWNAMVSENFAEWTGSAPVPGSNIAMTTTANELVMGTSGDDTFSGSTGTFQGGDTVRGGGGNDILMLSLQAGLYNNVTTQGVNRIEIDADGDVTVGASKFSTELQSILITNKSTGNMVLNDLQEDSRNSIMFELNDVAADVTLNFDQQAVQGASTVEVMLTEVTGALALVGENGEAIETTILNVQDVKGAASTLKSLSATGGTTLEIKGGLAGQAFTITAPLPSTLTTVNAASAAGVFAGNLVLDVTGNGASKALALTGGSGDDKINIGDGYGDGDVLNGGAGADEITINFTTSADTTRAAAMTKFETANVAFNAPVSFEGAAVDDLKTINLNASTSRADFNKMDSTLTTLNIKANLAQGVEVDYDGVAFASLDINIEGTTKDVAAPATAAIGNAGNTSAIRVINADTVNLTTKATGNVTLDAALQLDDKDANGRSTSVLNIQSQSDFDLTILGSLDGGGVLSAIVDSNDVQEVTVQTNKFGRIFAGNADVAFMEDADALQNLTIKSSTDGDIEMGLIGARDSFGDFGDNPSDLETITIDAALSSTITQWGIDADDSFAGAGSASTVNTINITGGRSSTVNLFGSTPGINSLENNRGGNVQGPVFGAGAVTGDNWLQSASIGTLMINTLGLVQGEINAAYDMNDGGATETFFNNLIGLDQEVQQGGSNVMVSGSGNVTGLYFQDEVAALVDATGLTSTAANHSVDLAEATNGFQTGYDIDVPQDNLYTFAVLANDPHNAPASKGFTFRGTESGDLVFATNSADTLSGNGGNDLLVGYGGADTIDGGAGNDVLFGDSMDPNRGLTGNATAVGNDNIVGGAGNDWIIGGGNAANKAGTLETLSGGAGLDVFAYVFDSASLVDALGANPLYTEAGKSTSLALGGQDVITDYTPGVDVIQIDAAGGGDNAYAIAFYAGQGAVATNIGAGGSLDVQVVVRRGDYNANGTFNLSATGADYQVLFAADGADFSSTMFARTTLLPAAFAGGGVDFTEAVHEIGILGLAAQGGSLTTSDFLFV
jgi:hypothetical protein